MSTIIEVADAYGNVTISKTFYDALIADQKKLTALEASGVDNWEGYDDAMSDVESMEDAE